MNELVKKNWNKSKYLILYGLIIISLLLVSVVFKGDRIVQEKTLGPITSYEPRDLKIFKEFLLGKIKSPFINLNYEIIKKLFIFSLKCVRQILVT